MADQPETPFDSIENAHEYLGLLLEAIQEAQEEIKAEILRAEAQRLDRQKQAMQLATYKMSTLYSHVSTSRRILNDLRMLRRLLLEEGKARKTSSEA